MQVTETVHGCRIFVWEVECQLCGFVTGLAWVHAPDGRSRLWSGAGCLETPRRTPKVARAWAERVAKEFSEGL